MISPVLEIRNLSVELPVDGRSLPLISNLDLQIGRGEIVGIVGESGAGKTTVGDAIIGLLLRPARISAGEIWLDGARIDRSSEANWQRIRGRKVGKIFQDPLTSLNPLFSVGDQLIETIQYHFQVSRSVALDRAVALLEDVGIRDAGRRIYDYPHQFSGGMRQRIVIALALCPEPSLIIADEPTSALDVSVQKQITMLLRHVCGARGTAVMLITHDLGVIAETTDHVGVLYCGRLMEFGQTASTIEKPLHPYTAGLVACVPDTNIRNRRFSDIGGSLPRLTAVPSGCPFHPRCSFQFEPCAPKRPPIIKVGATEVACWLHVSAAPDAPK